MAGETVFAQTPGNTAVTNLAERRSGDQFTFNTKTPKGAVVYGVKPLSRGMLAAIDKGLDDLFAVARKHGYRLRLNHSYYSIYIARPDRLKNRNGDYSPGIAVNAPEYNGSEYDQGGFIYVAGVVFYLNPDAFLIVDYDKNFDAVSEIVRFEGEHIILYYNDRKLYNKTGDHSRGGGHPILK
ncbi:MAG: hypothetical protein ACR2L1_05065 [Pyrinomonadaceae bacterium]